MEPTHHTTPAPDEPGVRPPRSVLVVGAGLAGTQTAAALRGHGFTGHLTVLGAEGLPPYDRPPLSKELFTRRAPAWLTDELGVDLSQLADELVLGDAARHLEHPVPLADHSVSVATASGRRVHADVVVLACGSVPVRPAGWEDAVTLHGATDADHLRSRLVPGARLVCIGAGWIGAEVAGAAAAAGCEVTVIEAAGVPLHRQLGPTVGAHLSRWYDAAGVTLVTGAPVVGVDASGVHLGTTTPRAIPADVVLAAVGARPATDWLADALPRDARGAIRVDARGRVVETGTVAGGTLFAVGDCATRADPVWDQVPGGHWSAALLDPDAVAREILGLEPGAGHAPYVFSTQLGHDLALFGLPDPVTDSVVLRGDPAGAGWAALYVSPAGLVTGMFVVDSPKDVAAARRMMVGGPVKLDLLRAADPQVSLRATLV
ncbi:NADPH-dependent 2,4-dienoyl-CoA reductase, sulfur reductase [Sanguibacter gelidistatuariae]|uniref:NADPH-dependent 2,4-dienoyl-CoA reductase, sulfur reductase n=1 Tax=Sanguibacter gelidistatuariae TaxID=1814289 RepID=A0A1G6KT13_9MICO|nr:FAD-dependent oxidoreductase [Sanguibacter gelidistatuariae]SDC34242.1 NADPH-dependent 2,4-dienoyl-CoA reductase, sulfur reductase [Sanguibacter gelidistatuariae]